MGQPDKEEDKLLRIQVEIGLPVKLSELEQEKFNKTFEALKGWLDDAKVIMLEKDRDEAYRYINLLISHLQMVDVDFVAGASQASPVMVPSAEQNKIGAKPEETHKIRSPPRHKRPTKEQVDGWIKNMQPGMKEKAVSLLDCLKQYLDPEGEVGIEIICSDCSPDRMVQCIRNEDPSIEDSMTIFMRHQLEG